MSRLRNATCFALVRLLRQCTFIWSIAVVKLNGITPRRCPRNDVVNEDDALMPTALLLCRTWPWENNRPTDVPLTNSLGYRRSKSCMWGACFGFSGSYIRYQVSSGQFKQKMLTYSRRRQSCLMVYCANEGDRTAPC